MAFCLIVLGWTAEIVGTFVKDPEKVCLGPAARVDGAIADSMFLPGQECHYCVSCI